MLTYTLHSLVAHRSRLLLTAIAIVLGVGTIAGTFVLTDTARAAAERTFTDPGRGVAVVVVAPPQLGNDEDLATRFETGDFPPVPADAAERVAQVDGVAGVTAVVSGRARLVGRNGRVVVDERTPQGRSIDGSFAGRVRAGRLPAAPGEVVLDEITALTKRFRVGDRVRVLTYMPAGPKGLSSGGAVQAATVVGVVDGSEFPDAVLVGLDPGTAARSLAWPGEVNYLEVRADAGVGERELRDRVAATLGPEFAAYTAATVTAERARRAQPDDLIRQIAVIAGLVALFMGAFVIRNTFTIVLAAEARELALLRCIGASRGQVRRSALLKSLLVGGIAALGGLAFGVAVAWGLGALLESAGEIRADVTGTAPRIHARTVLIAVAVGATTAVFSAWGPARRASRQPPVAALRGEVFAVARRENRLRTAIGTVAVLAGVGLVLAGGLGDPVRSGLLTAGTVATAVGVLVLGPVVARALAGLIGGPISRARGAVGELARGNAVRSPRRTSATVLPLVIGLALTAFLMTVAAGTKAWAVGGLDRAVRADFQLATVPGNPPHTSSRPPMRQEVADRLAGLPELAAVAVFETGGVNVANGEGVTAVDPTQLGTNLSVPVTAGAWTDVTPGSIAVSAGAGQPLGSTVTVRGARGEQALTVRAVYAEPDLGYIAGDVLSLPFGRYLMTPADYRRLAAADDNAVAAIYVTTRRGVSDRAARAAIGRSLTDHPDIEIASRDEVRHRVLSRIDPALRLYYSLLGLMILIALFGVVNTLVLSIVERVREFGLLRAIGMDRGQLRAMVRWEATIVAGIGVAIGLGIGVFLGWGMTEVLEQPVTIPYGQLAVVAVAAFVVVVLGSVIPAARAGRIDTLRAIAME